MTIVWTLLSETPTLTAAARQHVAKSLGADSATSPQVVRAFFDRQDLEPADRACLLDSVSAETCALILASPNATIENAQQALQRYPHSSEVLSACLQRADFDLLTPNHLRALDRETLLTLMGRLDSGFSTAHEAVMTTILDSRPGRPQRTPDQRTMTDAQLDEFREKYSQWRKDVFSALTSVSPAGRLTLATTTAERGHVIRGVLLEFSDNLDDATLLACLPSITCPKDGWQDEKSDEDLDLGVMLRMIALRTAAKFPRYRDLAGDQLHGILVEAVERGWWPPKPEASSYIHWEELHAAAVFAQDSELIDCLATHAKGGNDAGPSRWRWSADWRDKQGRHKLLCLLLNNPAVGSATHQAVLTSMPDDDLTSLARASGLSYPARTLIAAEQDRRTAAAEAAKAEQHAEQQSRFPPAPTDEELAACDDPAAALASLIRNTRYAPTPVRTATIERILSSRHVTRDVAWRLPVVRLLDHDTFGPLLAAEIAEACGTSHERWTRLREQTTPRLSPNVNANTLLDRIIKDPSRSS